MIHLRPLSRGGKEEVISLSGINKKQLHTLTLSSLYIVAVLL